MLRNDHTWIIVTFYFDSAYMTSVSPHLFAWKSCIMYKIPTYKSTFLVIRKTWFINKTYNRVQSLFQTKRYIFEIKQEQELFPRNLNNTKYLLKMPHKTLYLMYFCIFVILFEWLIQILDIIWQITLTLMVSHIVYCFFSVEKSRVQSTQYFLKEKGNWIFSVKVKYRQTTINTYLTFWSKNVTLMR